MDVKLKEILNHTHAVKCNVFLPFFFLLYVHNKNNIKVYHSI